MADYLSIPQINGNLLNWTIKINKVLRDRFVEVSSVRRQH